MGHQNIKYLLLTVEKLQKASKTATNFFYFALYINKNQQNIFFVSYYLLNYIKSQLL